MSPEVNKTAVLSSQRLELESPRFARMVIDRDLDGFRNPLLPSAEAQGHVVVLFLDAHFSSPARVMKDHWPFRGPGHPGGCGRCHEDPDKLSKRGAVFHIPAPSLIRVGQQSICQACQPCARQRHGELFSA